MPEAWDGAQTGLFWLLLCEGFLELLKGNLLLKVTFFNHNYLLKSRNKI